MAPREPRRPKSPAWRRVQSLRGGGSRVARPGPALAAASLRHAPLTPTAQSATYGVPGAATTKLKPGARVRDEKRRGDARGPRKPRAARPAAASCGGISANFKNHSRPSRRLLWLRWAGSAAPFPPPALPQAGERPPPQGAAEATDRLAAPPLPHATGLNAGYRGQGRPLGEGTGCLRHAKPCRASPPRPRAPCPRWGRGARGERRGKRSWRLPQGSRSAEKPGPRTRSAAGPAGSRWSMRPRLGLGPKRFATGLASQERDKGPLPSSARLPPP